MSNNVVSNLGTASGGSCGNFALITDLVYVLNNAPTRCGPDAYLANGVCTPYGTTVCAPGYNDTQIVATRLESPTGAECGVGYGLVSKQAYIIESLVARCGAGGYPTAGGCAYYAAGDECPSDYYTPVDSFARPTTGNTCASGYTANNELMEYCQNTIGGVSNYICTPQRKCTIPGADLMKSTNGLTWQLYNDMLTIPSLTTEHDNGAKCHMNLLPGYEADNLIIEYNNTTYHGVKQ